MSAVEILAELPKLTGDERAAIRRRQRELDERDETQFLRESADAMFRDMDKQEAGSPLPPTGRGCTLIKSVSAKQRPRRLASGREQDERA